MDNAGDSCEVTISIVSHGQGAMVADLLGDISSSIDVEYEVILTLNIEENETFLAPFPCMPIKVLRNSSPKGFGHNHNDAFKHARGRCFAVVNPDIRAVPMRLSPLVAMLDDYGIGCCAPLVCSPSGGIEDSFRMFPTVTQLLKRKIFGFKSEYRIGSSPMRVDWVAGMFMLFRRETYRMIGGFDQRYFMYLEDADICRRIKLRGLETVVTPCVTVVHHAQRASARDFKHFKWHLHSVLRFISSTPKP